MEMGLAARTAEALAHDVRIALQFDPIVEEDAIGVLVEDGVVTLTGYVESLREAVAAERAVKRVDGVRSIANGLHVKTRNERTDTTAACRGTDRNPA